MAARIEWRTKGKGDDALLFVGEFGEDDNTVLRTWDADAALLTDFLNDMAGLDTKVAGLEVDAGQRDPEQWGRLVLSRAPSVEVPGRQPRAVLGWHLLLVPLQGRRPPQVARPTPVAPPCS